MAATDSSVDVSERDDYTRLAFEYRNSVVRCQQAIDQLNACKRELRGITGIADGDPVLNVELEMQIATLSKRELEVFTLIGYGLTTQEVAGQIEISMSTVETYRERLKFKLKVSSGAVLTRLAVLWCAKP